MKKNSKPTKSLTLTTATVRPIDAHLAAVSGGRNTLGCQLNTITVYC